MGPCGPSGAVCPALLRGLGHSRVKTASGSVACCVSLPRAPPRPAPPARLGSASAALGDVCPSPCRARSPTVYHEFVGVGACRDALHLYWLLWASAVLNVLGLLLGVVTAAILGAFKDAVSAPAPAGLAAASALQPVLPEVGVSLRRERPEPAQGQSGTWSLVPDGLAMSPWPEACGIPAPPPHGSGAWAYTSPGTGDSVCVPKSLPECLGGSPHGWPPPLRTGFSRPCFQAEPTGHLPQPPPSSEVPHVRPPVRGSAHDRLHQQPRSHHPALEKRQCGRTSKWPPVAQTPAPPQLKQPIGGLLPLTRRLAIARISQLSLEPLKSCDMFLEGFLTPGESWETMGDPGAPVTSLLPGSHPGPCRPQAQLLLGHKARQPASPLAPGLARVCGAF